MKYFEKRQNPLENCPIEEIERVFAKVAEHFDHDWLRLESGDHILQKLWLRRDALSTNEIFTFGAALIAAEQASKAWLKKQVKLVKGKDKNNQKGAIFEILAVGYTASRQSVSPAIANQPGYDLDLETHKSTKYRVSLKCYSESSHEKLFRKRAIIAREKFVASLKLSGINASVYIEAAKYPAESDWQNLYVALKELASNFDGSKKIYEIEKRWLIGLMPLLSDNGEAFAGKTVSHTFVCASPYHKNEQHNFISKLGSALANLEKHVDAHTQCLPVILMRLPATASASTLTKWSNEYFSENSSSSVGAVFFLQPYTTSDNNMSSSCIAYYISVAASKWFIDTPKKALQFEVPVGLVSKQEPAWQLRSDVGAKPLVEEYVYQHGSHYIAANYENGAMSANITRKAPGIESFAVFNINGKPLVLGGRWGNELCLIGG